MTEFVPIRRKQEGRDIDGHMPWSHIEYLSIVYYVILLTEDWHMRLFVCGPVVWCLILTMWYLMSGTSGLLTTILAMSTRLVGSVFSVYLKNCKLTVYLKKSSVCWRTCFTW